MKVEHPQPISVFLADLVTAQDLEKILLSENLSFEENYTQPSSPSYFAERDTLASIKCDDAIIKLVAPSEGYYSHILVYSNLKSGDVICKTFATNSAAEYYGYKIKYATYIDPITDEFCIRWKSVCSFVVDGFYAHYTIIKLDVNGCKPYVTFRTDRQRRLCKGDEVIFLLQEKGIKQIVKFTVTQTSQRVDSNEYIVKVPLFEDDLIYLQKLNLELVRFVYKNGRDDFNCTIHLHSDNEKDEETYKFKCYVSCYCHILGHNNVIIPKFKTITTLSDTIDYRDKVCYVYLMIDTTNGFHKIGISNKPKYRERTLQSEKPTIEMVCAKQYPSRIIAEAIESALHKAFEEKRVRGEWFDLSKQEVKMIEDTLK
ncbi:MAG: GIY-YIG nuclease family protein [Alistipes sp.]|nr:GIY-YIG nuclease family protein [Alistipes sp.]